MRLWLFIFGLASLVLTVSAAWSKEDREIFKARADLQKLEGQDVTFYDFLGVKPQANFKQITQAVRKRTLDLHPDKVQRQLIRERKEAAEAAEQNASDDQQKQAKAKPTMPTKAEVKKAIQKASEKQALLTIIANILKGPGRDRYNHFLRNGFPAYKNSDYYYERFRPGFGTVLAGFTVVVLGGFHYLALYLGWKRQRDFMDRYIQYARNTAWGPDGLDFPTAATAAPGSSAPVQAEEEAEEQQQQMQPRNRKERRMMERGNKNDSGTKKTVHRRAKTAAGSKKEDAAPATTATPTGARKRIVAENGKVLVVDSLGDVYLEEVDSEGQTQLFLLDPNELAAPTFHDTAVVRLPKWLWKKATGKSTSSNEPADEKEPTVVEVATTSKTGKKEKDDAQPNSPGGNSSDGFEFIERSSSDGDENKQGKKKSNKKKGNKKR